MQADLTTFILAVSQVRDSWCNLSKVVLEGYSLVTNHVPAQFSRLSLASDDFVGSFAVLIVLF